MSDWGRKRNDTALGIGFRNTPGHSSPRSRKSRLTASTGDDPRSQHLGGDRPRHRGAAGQRRGADREQHRLWPGFALSERITIKDGVVQQSNFYDYHVPRMNEMPEIHVELIATDNHPTGVGQMATPLVAPAIANAVAELTGVRLRETPMTSQRVKKALG